MIIVILCVLLEPPGENPRADQGRVDDAEHLGPQARLCVQDDPPPEVAVEVVVVVVVVLVVVVVVVVGECQASCF